VYGDEKVDLRKDLLMERPSPSPSRAQNGGEWYSNVSCRLCDDDCVYCTLQQWEDYQLQWDPADYGGITVIRILPDQVWKPDVVLFNKCVHHVHMYSYQHTRCWNAIPTFLPSQPTTVRLLEPINLGYGYS